MQEVHNAIEDGKLVSDTLLRLSFLPTHPDVHIRSKLKANINNNN